MTERSFRTECPICGLLEVDDHEECRDLEQVEPYRPE